MFRADTAKNINWSDSKLNKKLIKKIYKLWGPATDTLRSQACQSVYSSSGKFNISTTWHLVFRQIAPIPRQTEIFTVCTGDGWTADCKLSASRKRHDPKSSMPVTLLKLWEDSDKQEKEKVALQCKKKNYFSLLGPIFSGQFVFKNFKLAYLLNVKSFCHNFKTES